MIFQLFWLVIGMLNKIQLFYFYKQSVIRIYIKHIIYNLYLANLLCRIYNEKIMNTKLLKIIIIVPGFVLQPQL